MLYAYKDSFDLMFLTETWFQDHSRMTAHPMYLCSSPMVEYPHGTRPSGGLFCFCSMSFRATVTNAYGSQYTLEVTASSKRVVGVYLPPSIPRDQMETIVSGFSGAYVIIGDNNVSYGPLWGQNVYAPSWKMELFNKMCRLGQLLHVRPPGNPPRNDHLYAKEQAQAKLTVEKAPINSDHQVLIADVMLEHVFNPNVDSLKRFHLRKLDNPVSSSLLCTLFRESSKSLLQLFDRGILGVESMSLDMKQTLVDCFDAYFLEHVSNACSEALGTYLPARARQYPDNLQASLNSDAYETAALLFKRSQKMLSNRPMQSRTPHENSPVQDAEMYFNSLFLQEIESLKVKTGEVSSALGSSSGDILEYFTSEEIKKYIRGYPKSTSCGEDSIHVLILEVLIEADVTLVLNRLFHFIVLAGVTPQRWNKTILHLLPKTPSAETVDACRPIALSSMLRRLFEKCLLNAMTSSPQLATLCKFSPTQAGFRKGFSAQTLALYAHEIASSYKQYHVFVDLKSAYDCVPLPKLFELVRVRARHAGVLSLVLSLFSSCSSSAIVNFQKTKNVKRERGLMQGSVLSPFLFNVFIDEIAVMIERDFPVERGYVYPVLFFADDIKIQSVEAVVVKKILACLGKWFTDNGLTVNVSKSAVIAHPSKEQTVFSLQGHSLPSVHSYSYLGFPFYHSGIVFSELGSQASESISKQVRFLSSFGENWHVAVRRNIYLNLLQPKLHYHLPLLFFGSNLKDLSSIQALKRIDEVQTQAISWVVGIKGYPNLCASLTGIPRVETLGRHMGVKFANQFSLLAPENPLVKLSKTKRLSLSRPQSLTTQFVNNKLEKKLPTVPAHASRPDFTLAKRIYLMHLKAFESTPTAKFILPKSRSGVYKNGQTLPSVDKVLLIKDLSILKLAISWRCNTFLFQYQCHCLGKLGRRHISDCNLLDGFPIDLTKEMNDFQDESIMFSDVFKVKYSLIDSLLNNGKYELFKQVLGFIVRKCKPYKKDLLSNDHIALFNEMTINQVGEIDLVADENIEDELDLFEKWTQLTGNL